MIGSQRRLLIRSTSDDHDYVAGFASRSGNGPLVSFLRRHPFTSFHILEGVFGKNVMKTLLDRESKELRKVKIPGLDVFYAQKKEPDATLLGCHRREAARHFVLAGMGSEAVCSGISPGFEADGEFYWDNKDGVPWWRIWVEVGGCAPEALPFIVNPPEEYGDQVRDLVLVSDIERLDLLAAQIENRWGGRHEVSLWQIGSDANRSVRPKSKGVKKLWKPYRRADVEALIRQRQRGSHHKSYLGKIGCQLSADDWAMLIEIGNNPFFTAYELSYLWTDTFKGVQMGLERVSRLENLGLLETARDAGPRYLTEGRKVLTWRALDLLAEHWGTTAEIMRRFHPWPQREDSKGKGHVEYSTMWASYLNKHECLTRRFVLALLFGARCVTNLIGGAEVEVDTTIGSRILCRNQAMAPYGEMTSVAPDARVRVEIWQRGWLEGATTARRSIERRTLLIEADRSTIPAEKLKDRMDRYATVWKSLAPQRPALVWVIDGSPFREKQVLDMMRERKLDGWTVILERLILPEDDPWWLVHPPTSLSKRGSQVGLRYESIRGMAPWRTIWMTPDRVGYQPLLGLKPWTGRRLHGNVVGLREKSLVEYKTT